MEKVYLFFVVYYDVCVMVDGVVIVMVMGMGMVWVVVSVMVLGFDLWFDLLKVYWIVVGIVGVDLVDVLIGLVVWVEWIVDGDFVYEIDLCEMLKDWKMGYFLLYCK